MDNRDEILFKCSEAELLIEKLLNSVRSFLVTFQDPAFNMDEQWNSMKNLIAEIQRYISELKSHASYIDKAKMDSDRNVILSTEMKHRQSELKERKTRQEEKLTNMMKNLIMLQISIASLVPLDPSKVGNVND